MKPFSKRAANQPFATFLNELEPIFNGMLNSIKSKEADLQPKLKTLHNYIILLGKLIRKYHFKVRRGSVATNIIKLADHLDAIGAQSLADIIDKKVIQLYAQPTPQQQQLQLLSERFLNIHIEMLNATRSFANPLQIPQGMKHILDEIRELGLAANALKQYIGMTTTTANLDLTLLADNLDSSGLFALADIVDYVNKLVKKGEGEEKLRPSLSTRYCPDHVGVQAVRVDNYTYQCPIDGRIYDYANGYTDYSGTKVPGGSIAAQTPVSEPFGLPQRLYDSRQNIINTIN